MKELGANELALHYDTGVYAKELGIDRIVSIGPLAKELSRGAEDVWFESIDALTPELTAILREDDTVLVKASHSMQFEKIVEFLSRKEN